MDFSNLFFAFELTLLAGISTGIGSCLAFFTKRTNTKFLSVALGFSAGVMIYVSMIEIFYKAKDSLVKELGKVAGSWVTVGAFFGGILLIAANEQFSKAIVTEVLKSDSSNIYHFMAYDEEIYYQFGREINRNFVGGC